MAGGIAVGPDSFLDLAKENVSKIHLAWVHWNGFTCLAVTSRSKPWLVEQS